MNDIRHNSGASRLADEDKVIIEHNAAKYFRREAPVPLGVEITAPWAASVADAAGYFELKARILEGYIPRTREQWLSHPIVTPQQNTAVPQQQEGQPGGESVSPQPETSPAQTERVEEASAPKPIKSIPFLKPAAAVTSPASKPETKPEALPRKESPPVNEKALTARLAQQAEDWSRRPVRGVDDDVAMNAGKKPTRNAGSTSITAKGHTVQVVHGKVGR